MRVNTYGNIDDAKERAKKFAAHLPARMRILCLGGQIYENTFKAGRKVKWTRRV